MRRRPKRSESLPNTAMLAVNDSMKPENTHENDARQPSWASSVGIAVVTKVVSVAARKRLSMSAPVMTWSRVPAGSSTMGAAAETSGSSRFSDRCVGSMAEVNLRDELGCVENAAANGVAGFTEGAAIYCGSRLNRREPLRQTPLRQPAGRVGISARGLSPRRQHRIGQLDDAMTQRVHRLELQPHLPGQSVAPGDDPLNVFPAIDCGSDQNMQLVDQSRYEKSPIGRGSPLDDEVLDAELSSENVERGCQIDVALFRDDV